MEYIIKESVGGKFYIGYFVTKYKLTWFGIKQYEKFITRRSHRPPFDNMVDATNYIKEFLTKKPKSKSKYYDKNGVLIK